MLTIQPLEAKPPDQWYHLSVHQNQQGLLRLTAGLHPQGCLFSSSGGGHEYLHLLIGFQVMVILIVWDLWEPIWYLLSPLRSMGLKVQSQNQCLLHGWNFLEMQILRLHTRPAESETLGWTSVFCALINESDAC